MKSNDIFPDNEQQLSIAFEREVIPACCSYFLLGEEGEKRARAGRKKGERKNKGGAASFVINRRAADLSGRVRELCTLAK